MREGNPVNDSLSNEAALEAEEQSYGWLLFASIVLICEVKKLLHIRTGEEPEAAAAAAAAGAA